ncbi:MAG: BamA/TamA family outer membrane protein [Bacteroidota bacterium]
MNQLLNRNCLYRVIVFFGAFFILQATTQAQVYKWAKKTFNKYFNDTTASTKPKFIAYPVISFTPETSWEFGASALYVYYANRDIANRLSEVSAFTFLTLESQYGLFLDHALYTDKNKYFSLGKIRIQQFPLLYYGIGVNTPEDAIAQVDGFSIAIRERLLRQIKGSLYAGLELDFTQLSGVTFNEKTSTPFVRPQGSSGSTNYGIGIGVVFDERHNVLNARKGIFAEAGFLHYDDAWGSDFSFTNYFLDARYYLPTTKKQVLAYQFLANLVLEDQGSEVPFNQLALMGGESLMRGYYLGRYRDNVLLATQIEYRFLPLPFSKRFGATVFASAGGVAPSVPDLNLSNFVGAGGAGLRFLLFPEKDIFTRFDLAVTSEGLGYYLFIGEAF